ncbi:5964_t:CDS:2, partial [Cetraspora pellucida]
MIGQRIRHYEKDSRFINCNRADEKLYEMHLDLMKEMEMELKTDNNHNNFITTINNPVGIHSKGQKRKNANLDILKLKTGSTIQKNINSVKNSDLISIVDKNSIINRLRHCGACGQAGHNTHT